MAKKKEKTTVQIQNLNLEIDYDKLADAIVRAQRKSEERPKVGKYTKGVLTLPLLLFFRGIAILGWLLAACTPYSLFQTFHNVSWKKAGAVVGNLISIVTAIAIALSIALFSFILWKSAKEVENEKDRFFLVSLFSGIVSFVALIVAVIALYK